MTLTTERLHSADVPFGTGRGRLVVVERSQDRWVVVEEVACPDGNSDAAVRAFKAAHPEYTAEPDRLRIDTFCHRDSGQSSVRFSWNETPAPKAARRKPRHPK